MALNLVDMIFQLWSVLKKKIARLMKSTLFASV